MLESHVKGHTNSSLHLYIYSWSYTFNTGVTTLIEMVQSLRVVQVEWEDYPANTEADIRPTGQLFGNVTAVNMVLNMCAR